MVFKCTYLVNYYLMIKTVFLESKHVYSSCLGVDYLAAVLISCWCSWKAPCVGGGVRVLAYDVCVLVYDALELRNGYDLRAAAVMHANLASQENNFSHCNKIQTSATNLSPRALDGKEMSQ